MRWGLCCLLLLLLACHGERGQHRFASGAGGFHLCSIVSRVVSCGAFDCGLD